MKKMNLIAASVALLVAGVANAGTLSTADSGGTVFATENFGGSASGTTQAALAIVPGAITYNTSTITAVNAATPVYFTIRLNGGKFAAAPAVGTLKVAGITCGAAGMTCTVDLSDDFTTALVTATPTASQTLGLGALIYTPAATDIVAVNTTLGAVGGQVTATVGLTSSAPSSYEATDTQATLDTPLASAVVATSAVATTSTVGAYTTSAKIDLGASTGTATQFIVGSTAQAYGVLGQVKFANATGTQNVLAGGDFTVAANNTGAKFTVTLPSGQALPASGTPSAAVNTIGVYSDVTCGTAVATAQNITSSNAAGPFTFTTSAAVAAATYYVCVNIDATNKAAIAPVTASITGQLLNTGNTSQSFVAGSGTGNAITYNGTSVTVSNYWPAALTDAYNYQGFVRIVNTGTLAAVFNGQFVNADGTKSATAPITASIPAGGSVTVSSQAIEAALGAKAATDRPRLTVSGNTSSADVQTFIQSPNGTFVKTN